jgi:spermidine/putrescine transport system ATP-binding protein
MLRLVRLEGYGPRKPDQLSGGQAQRVALARALINHPKVLLLDEPLGALDLKLRKEMQLELRSLHQRLGMTFVYVTHDQEEAMVMSDRIVLMNCGRIVQVGSPAEVYNRPASEFASRFIGEANLLNGRIRSIDQKCISVDADGLTLITPKASGFAVDQPVMVSMRPERVSLFRPEDPVPQTCQNVFDGTIEGAIFLGPSGRYHVRLAEGQVIVVDQAATEGVLRYQVGDQVRAGWDISSSVVLAAPEECPADPDQA